MDRRRDGVGVYKIGIEFEGLLPLLFLAGEKGCGV